MKPTIEDLQDTFKYSYDIYRDSRAEADEVRNLYHNRHFTKEQLAILADRGQPAETFNIIKMFTRMLVGYYSTVVNTAKVSPVNYRDVPKANILSAIISHTFKHNRIDSVEGDKIKLNGMLSGLLISYVDVVDTGRRDEFNRPINQINMSYVPDTEVLLDPASTQDDYSDATFLHRFKWMSEEACRKLFGNRKINDLTEYYNHVDVEDFDFETLYKERFNGKYKIFNNYLIVHTVMEEPNGKRWSIFWSEDTILKKTEITYKDVRWPYRVEKLHTSDIPEYYGMFREVVQSQHAINQAVLKIQLMINSDKVLVQEDSVDNIAEFEAAYNRVNAVIPTLKNSGIKIEQLAKEVQDNYNVIDQSLTRIQRVLGINESFLGMAYASDSGRKVKLQQSATIMSLRYVTARIESFYELVANDIGKLAQQYYNAHQMLRLADDTVGSRWIELNRPLMEQGGVNQDGSPALRPILMPEADPLKPDDFLLDDEGNIVIGPVTEHDFSYTDYEIDIESASYNDEDERAQLLLETFMSGAIGQMTMQVNPAGFFQMGALSMKSMKTKYSPEIVKVLEQTAQMLQTNQGMNQEVAQANRGSQQGMGQSQPQSRSLKLPTNTQGEQ